MTGRFGAAWEPAAEIFLRECFRFVANVWQHLPREPIPDQGFEEHFRAHCISRLQDWAISPTREMHLGANLDTASGVLHEIDLAVTNSAVTGVAELKNYNDTPGKNDVIIFHAKVLDYLLANAHLLHQELCLVFLANSNLDDAPLAACLGLGIHPVTPQLRPLPLLVANARVWQRKIDGRVTLPDETMARYEDFCARLSRVAISLHDTWPTCRYGYQGPGRIVVRATSAVNSYSILSDIRSLNADCPALLSDFQRAEKAAD